MRAEHPSAANRARSQPAGWRWRLLVGVVAALVVVTGVVSIASASSGRGGGAGERTLRFRTTLVSSAVNDAGHLHRGDHRRDGAFAGANGQIDKVVVAPGVIDRTFHLLPRHD
jgi:hypothetical protein